MRSAALMFCLLMSPAVAQERAWSDVIEAEGTYSIYFGVPESDDAPFFMNCTKEGEQVAMSWHADVEKPKGMKTSADGMRMPLENQNIEIRFADGDDAASEKLTGTFHPEEMYGAIFVDMSVPKNAAVLQKLRTSSDAALIIAGAEPQTLDLKGADASIGKLLAACR